MIEQPITLEEVFPYEYVSGGYFRHRGVSKGESAETLHGMQAIEFLFNTMLTHVKNTTSSASKTIDRTSIVSIDALRNQPLEKDSKSTDCVLAVRMIKERKYVSEKHVAMHFSNTHDTSQIPASSSLENS